MSLNSEQKERYSRHIMLREIGESGQEKLLNSKVLIIGAGGLGSPAAMYLSAAGVGTVGIADGDTVELSNLQRQILHGTKDLGRPKAESAGETLEALNPDVRVVPYPFTVTRENAAELIAGYDFILECTDSFDAKYLINDACVLAGKPFCHGGISRFFGQLMTYVPGRGPCYRCVFKNPPAEAGKEGVIGALPGTIGTLQAMEAIKYILGTGELLTGQLLTYDALDAEFQKITLRCDPDCPVCGKRR